MILNMFLANIGKSETEGKDNLIAKFCKENGKKRKTQILVQFLI